MSEDLHLELTPDVDLDELTRALRKAAEQAAPALGTDEQGSFLTNTHLGNASHQEDEPAASVAGTVPPLPNEALADEAELPEAATVSGAEGEVLAAQVAAKVDGVAADAAAASSQAGAGDRSRSAASGDALTMEAGAGTGQLGGAGPGDGAVAAAAFSGEAAGSETTAAAEVEMDVNEAPTDIVVEGGTVSENAAAGTVVATLKAVDGDAGESFTYALDADASGKFEIVGNELRVKAGASLDYESASSHEVVVTVTDAGGLTHTETIKIAVANQNEAPVDITVVGGTVQENAAGGTVVATLGAVDPDGAGTFTYSLDADASGQFEIVGNEVRVKAGANIDYESATSHDLVVRVTDAGGLTHAETIKIAVTNQSGSFTGTNKNDILNGTSEEDVIDGGAGNDRLNGGGGSDTLIGGAGNDTLDGGAGGDSMRGGTGNDTYVVNSAGDTVTELAGEGTDTVQSSVSFALGDNVENLTLTGTAKIDGTGNTLANTLTGNAADNVLDGGAGNDRLNAGGGSDTLLGGAGNDTLNGGAGDDSMRGGTGNDTYVVDSAGDTVVELAGEGTDTVQSSVSFALGANVENLTLTGAAKIDGAGNDLNNTLTGNAADNVLDGGAGNDRLNGGSGNDTLLGGAGNDRLDGGAGDDVLLGGAGNDTLIGGTGSDLFVYMSGQGSDVVNGGSGSWTDTIALDGGAGSLQMGADWTLTLQSGNIVGQDSGELILSANADGFISFADGSRMDFVDIERVQW